VFARILAVLLLAAVAVALAAHPSGGAGRERAYLVERYDTLWSIAASHYAGDTREAIWKIERRNHLGSALIRPGQRLVLPP
jgi:nucleoid-associated protein YgaU